MASLLSSLWWPRTLADVGTEREEWTAVDELLWTVLSAVIAERIVHEDKAPMPGTRRDWLELEAKRTRILQQGRPLRR